MVITHYDDMIMHLNHTEHNKIIFIFQLHIIIRTKDNYNKIYYLKPALFKKV